MGLVFHKGNLKHFCSIDAILHRAMSDVIITNFALGL